MTDEQPGLEPGDGSDPAAFGRQLLQLRQSLTNLVRELAALRRQVNSRAGTEDLENLTTQLGALSARLAGLEDQQSEKATTARPWDWSVLLFEDSQQSQDALTTLTNWTSFVLDRMYGLVGLEDEYADPDKSSQLPLIPPCWRQHCDLVAELGWLCQEWIRIYRTPYGNPARAGDWHDRYLAGLRKRLLTTSARACIKSRRHLERQ